MSIQIHDLTDNDLDNFRIVTVTTPLASHFNVLRTAKGVYVAKDEYEFMHGFKEYKTLAAMRTDLAKR